MDRSHARVVAANRIIALLLAAAMLISASGCPALLATGIYVWEGGNLAPAECDALKGERVVVMCKPPSSHEYRHAGASRSIAQRVSELLVKNVKDIDVVNPREVDNWVDESDWGDFRELAQAVHADKVVHIELEDFELYKGKTLYQGQADVTVTVYDMQRPRQARVGPAPGRGALPGQQRHPGAGQAGAAIRTRVRRDRRRPRRHELLPPRPERVIRHGRDGESVTTAASLPADKFTAEFSSQRRRIAARLLRRLRPLRPRTIAVRFRLGNSAGDVGESLVPLPAEAAAAAPSRRPPPTACPCDRPPRASDTSSHPRHPSPARCSR